LRTRSTCGTCDIATARPSIPSVRSQPPDFMGQALLLVPDHAQLLCGVR
jgi:hypothetical protein